MDEPIFEPDETVLQALSLPEEFVRRAQAGTVYLTQQQLVKLLGVPTMTIWRWRQDGMPCYQPKQTGKIWFSLPKVMDWMSVNGKQDHTEDNNDSAIAAGE